MRKRIQKILQIFHLEDFAKSMLVKSICVGRDLLRTDKRTCKKYFCDNSVKKLHVGCGSHFLDGWLNSDYHPKSNRTICLDATKPFFFENDIFDYVFSEHMIEHISYPQGLQMLSECFRVLKPGGKIRIATPNLSFLIGLYDSDKSTSQKIYIKHVIDKRVNYAPRYEATFVINHFFHSWGHKFIYDEEALRHSLTKVGFTNISKNEISESEDKELRNLENTGRMPEIILKLETIVLGGTKPSQ